MADALRCAQDGSAEQDFIQQLADGYMNTDLNARCIRNKPATYLCLAPDDGIDRIQTNDTLVVDRSIKPEAGNIIMAVVDGDYCLRRLIKLNGKLAMADDKGYVVPRIVTDADYYQGTITHIIIESNW
jgi:DNA polymerase V